MLKIRVADLEVVNIIYKCLVGKFWTK